MENMQKINGRLIEMRVRGFKYMCTSFSCTAEAVFTVFLHIFCKKSILFG